MELALVQQVDHASRAERERDGRDEPEHGRERHVVSAQAVVERLGRQSDDLGGTVGEGVFVMANDAARVVVDAQEVDWLPGARLDPTTTARLPFS